LHAAAAPGNQGGRRRSWFCVGWVSAATDHHVRPNTIPRVTQRQEMIHSVGLRAVQPMGHSQYFRRANPTYVSAGFFGGTTPDRL